MMDESGKGDDVWGGRSYREIPAWEKSMDLAGSVCLLVAGWKEREQGRALAEEAERTVWDVPGLIAEGWAMMGNRELISHAYRALGRLARLDTLMLLGVRLGHMDHYDDALVLEVRRMLRGMIRHTRDQAN